MPGSPSRTLDPSRSSSPFRFRVNVGSGAMGFAEVSGLVLDAAPIDYRAGNRAAFSPSKMPSLVKTGTVVLRHGVLAADPELTAWLQQAGPRFGQRKTVTVTLIDETGKPVTTWTLTAAFPTKFVGSDLKASGNEVAVESLELSYEGLTVGDS